MAIITIKDKDGNLIDIPALQGQNGKSAYQYAKEQGFVGTEEEFAKTLVKTPLATNTTPGIVQGYTYYGHNINSNGAIMHENPTKEIIDSRRNYFPLSTSMIDYATKAALTDGKGDAWTEEEKANAKERLGITDGIEDVTVNGESVVIDGVASIPIAKGGTPGLMCVDPYTSLGGLYRANAATGLIRIQRATPAIIDERKSAYEPIVPNNLDYAVKQAMCDGKGEIWTSEEKMSARARIGINPWRLVAKAEIAESIRTIIFEKDSNNNDLNLKKVIIYIKSIKSTDSTEDGSGRIFINKALPNIFGGMYVKENAYYTNVFFELANNGIPFGYGTISSTSYAQNPTLKALYMSPEFTPQESIHEIKIDTDKQGCLYGTGTTIEIWGVDA